MVLQTSLALLFHLAVRNASMKKTSYSSLSCEEISGGKKKQKRNFNYINYILCVIAEEKFKNHFCRDLFIPITCPE